MASVALSVDGVEQVMPAQGMPRADVLRRYAPDRDPQGRSYRSGFWGFLDFPEIDAEREARIELVATLAGGERLRRPVASVVLVPALTIDPIDSGDPVAGDPSADEPLIAICMATYNPPPKLFQRQLESIRDQTHRNWVCVISDDCSRPASYERIEAEVGDDPRFVVSRSDRRRGYYRNFERALSGVPDAARYVAMCDQDDEWHPQKLELLRQPLDRGASLAYSDMRVVDADGNELSPTYWTDRETNHTNLASLMIANTITAAASMIRRDVLERALPFPARIGHAFHDHWIAQVALASGRIEYLARPLHDYVQHGANAFGAGGARWPRRGPALRVPTRTGVSLILRAWRQDYFHVVCQLQLNARILAIRCGDLLRGRKGRAVRWFLASQRPAASLAAIAWLWARSLGARRRRSPTMGQERPLIRGLAWRLLIPVNAASRRRKREHHAQGVPVPPPPPLDPAAGAGAGVDHRPLLVRQIPEKIAPLPLRVDPDERQRVNMLVPLIDLDHFFAAYIGKFNLARRLAEAGANVRIVAVEPSHLPDDWRARVQGYAGLGDLLDKVEVAFAPTREQLRLSVSPRDSFIATTSWTAHVAHAASQQVGRERFVFVIQEYDPLTFPVGTRSAVVRHAYRLPHLAVFSTELLRDYFRAHRLGVYAGDRRSGDRDSITFRNAISPVAPPSGAQLERQPRSLLFYARPEPHAERNLYELGLLGLGAAIDQGHFRGEWEYHGIGALEPARVAMTADAMLQIRPRRAQADYVSLLREQSVGLSLQDSPHPSLVPLEMAAAGMLVVTSTFENKTGEELSAISENLIAVEPTIDGVRMGLAQAVAGVGDFRRRLRGAKIVWPRTWEESFDQRFVTRLLRFLEQA